MPRAQIQMPMKNCETCGISFGRKRFNGTLEDAGVFRRRRFCCLSCASSRSRGGDSKTRCRARARVFLGKSCEACGSQRILHVHHVNGNWQDNDPLNLQTLCESCHHSWHSRHIARGLTPTTRMPTGARHSQILCPEALPKKHSGNMRNVQEQIASAASGDTATQS